MSLPPEAAKPLRDARRACAELQTFSAGRTNDHLQTDRAFQLLVERLLEIAGEALRHAERLDPSISGQIRDPRNIVGTRNRLIHGYDDIDYRLLWDIVEVYVPSLTSNLDMILNESPGLPSDPLSK